MKKILAIVAAIATLACFASCAGGGNIDGSSSSGGVVSDVKSDVQSIVSEVGSDVGSMVSDSSKQNHSSTASNK